MATVFTLDGPTPVLAYSERESCDPDTGEPGVLRQEWRAVPFDWDDPRHEAMQCGKIGFFASMVLECRYIRRGTEEPWQPFDVFEHLDGRYEAGERSYGLLESLLHGHSLRSQIVAVDPLLKRMQEDEAEEAARIAACQLAREEAQREADIRAERRRRGSIAFQKLARTEDGKKLCDLWDAFVKESTADAIERYRADPEFMRLYVMALYSGQVPAKRKALKEFFKYAGV